MKIYPLIFIVLIILIMFATRRARAFIPDTRDLKKQIAQISLNYLADHSNGALVIAFYQRGNQSFQGFGKIGNSNTDLPDAHTIFEIGSVTKNFTATALAKMANDGAVKLDDPISLYLPKDVVSPKKNGHEITLENLATHTSGLPRLPENFFATVKDQRNPYANYTTEGLYKSLATVQLASEPGEKSAYSNYGYGLLGKILELKASKPYEALIQEMICSPLGLKNTTTKLSAEQKERLTPGHNSKGEIVPNWNQDAMSPAGAICSDAEDMLKFIEANLGKTNSEISKALNVTQEIHFKTASGGIGLGWQIKQMAGSPTIFWHNGGTGGYRSFVGFDKQNQIGVVVLSNYGDAKDSSVDQIGMKLLKIGSSVSLE